MKSFSFAPVLALSLALVGCGWNPFHKMYSATAVIEIMPPDVKNIAYMEAEMEHWNRIPTEMLSPIFLTPIINEQELDQIWAKRFKPDQNAFSQQEALDHLRKVLKIGWVSGTNHIKVTASSEVPQEAADIANAVADSYKAQRDQEDEASYKREVDSLKNQINQQQKVVDDAKAAVAEKQLSMGGIRISLGPSHAHDQNPELTAFHDAQRQLQQEQLFLDALNIHLKQVIDDEKIMESPVRIVSRAVPPPE